MTSLRSALRYPTVTSTTGRLYLDLETRSPIDLKSCGTHTYARHPDTEIVVACWALGDGPVQTWWPGQPVPVEVLNHAGWVVAHNAAFERAVVQYVLAPRHGWPNWPVTHYDCTSGRAGAFNIAQGLDEAAKTLTGGEHRKDRRGDALIKLLCTPTGLVGGRYVYETSTELLTEFAEYCAQDVAVTRVIDQRLPLLSVDERQIAIVSDTINDYGVAVDTETLPHFVKLRDAAVRQIDDRIAELTDGAVTKHTQNQRLGKYLGTPGGSCAADVIKAEILKSEQDLESLYEALASIRNSTVPSSDPKVVAGALQLAGTIEYVEKRLEILRLREMVKSSLGKLDAFTRRTDSDGRLRGSYRYCGASQTGRWSASGVQLQNIPRDGAPTETDPTTGKKRKWGPQEMIGALLAANADTPPKLIGNKPLPHALSGALRALLKASPGNVLVQRDLSNIEGRVARWVAGDAEGLEVFKRADGKQGPDLYRITAGRILGKAPADVTDDERQNYGKIPELACQYGGSDGAFRSMAKNFGVAMPAEQVRSTVEGWRRANVPVVRCWDDLHSAFRSMAGAAGMTCISLGNFPGSDRLTGTELVRRGATHLTLCLPSGRALLYHNVRSVIEKATATDGREYERHAVLADDHRYGTKRLYGGLLFENVVQALSRDILAHHMLQIARAGIPIVHHAHDEIVVEVPAEWGDKVLAFMGDVMRTPPPWCADLPLASEGWIGERYRK